MHTTGFVQSRGDLLESMYRGNRHRGTSYAFDSRRMFVLLYGIPIAAYDSRTGCLTKLSDPRIYPETRVERALEAVHVFPTFERIEISRNVHKVGFAIGVAPPNPRSIPWGLCLFVTLPTANNQCIQLRP